MGTQLDGDSSTQNIVKIAENERIIPDKKSTVNIKVLELRTVH